METNMLNLIILILPLFCGCKSVRDNLEDYEESVQRIQSGLKNETKLQRFYNFLTNPINLLTDGLGNRFDKIHQKLNAIEDKISDINVFNEVSSEPSNIVGLSNRIEKLELEMTKLSGSFVKLICNLRESQENVVRNILHLTQNIYHLGEKSLKTGEAITAQIKGLEQSLKKEEITNVWLDSVDEPQNLQEGLQVRSVVFYSSCKDILKTNDGIPNGKYPIQLNKAKIVEVYCDMETDGGGWTIFQRRGFNNTSLAYRENFKRKWNDYETGFGSPPDDHWIGLQNIFELTHQNECNNELMITLTKWDGTVQFARYDKFHISSRDDHYRLHLQGFSGNISSDGMKEHNNQRFRTEDNYKIYNRNGSGGSISSSTLNCPGVLKGGFWYGPTCRGSNLNGIYSDSAKGQVWNLTWDDDIFSVSRYNYKKVEMKVRSVCN